VVPSDPHEIETTTAEIVTVTPLDNVLVLVRPATRHVLANTIDDNPEKLRVSFAIPPLPSNAVPFLK
jgi:hypothetical protein